MSVKVEGLDSRLKELAKLEKIKREAFAIGMLKAGLTLQKQSQLLVPVDTGALKSSAYTKLNGVEVSEGGEKGLVQALLSKVSSVFSKVKSAFFGASAPSVTVEVGYTQNYAVYVHEDLTANHPNGGQAKYLEQPARELQSQLFQIVKSEVNNA